MKHILTFLLRLGNCHEACCHGNDLLVIFRCHCFLNLYKDEQVKKKKGIKVRKWLMKIREKQISCD
jgi:hypothetical protein